MKKLKDLQNKIKFVQEKHDGIIQALEELYDSCEELHQLQKPFLKDPNISQELCAKMKGVQR